MQPFTHNFQATNVKPPPEGTLSRPHLMCDQTDLARVRAKISGGRPRALWRRVTSNCDCYLDPASDHFVDPTGKKGDLGVTRAGMYHTLRKATELAFVALVSGEDGPGKYAGRILHGLLDPRPVFKNVVLFWFLTRDSGDRPFPLAKLAHDSDHPMASDAMWLQIADMFNQPLARWFWRRRFDASCQSPDLAGAALDDWDADAVLNLLLCNDGDEDAGPRQLGVPSSYHFKKRGIVVARRDHDDQTPVLRISAGRAASQGSVHQHWDALAISLSAFGQRLIVDPGFDKVDGDPHELANLYTTTEAHSSVLIDGQGQEALSQFKIWPGLIVWHEQGAGMEYVLAAGAVRKHLWVDGYANCQSAERHVLVVHEGATPFYVVVCDMFDYPDERAAAEPALQHVLVTEPDCEIAVDERGAGITGPKAGLRAELVTREHVTATVDRLRAANHPRLIWSRRGRHGRFLTVLTPLNAATRPPAVQLLADDADRTACRVTFGDHDDHHTVTVHGYL